MIVNVICESVFLTKFWGGIHTAFLNNVESLRRKNVHLVINSPSKADITHIHSILPFALYKLFTSHKVVVSCHVIPETTVGTFKLGKYGLNMLKWYLKIFYNKADVLIIQNINVKKILEKLGVHKKIVVIPNPVNSNIFKHDKNMRFMQRKKMGFSKEDFVILSVGNCVARKGFQEFIILAKELPQYKFVWVGGKVVFGSDSKVKKTLFDSIPENMLITGFINYSEMPLYYNMADVFLFPSHNETQGMVIIEAAACGLPLVLRDLPEYKELYHNMYISCTNTREFKNAVSELYSKKQFYSDMSEKSKKVLKLYSLDFIGDLLLEQYHNLYEKRLLNTL
jgi:1,2-diacylglycerol-3-alpha-glucose alpha-1,2-galactosyltransferase